PYRPRRRPPIPPRRPPPIPPPMASSFISVCCSLVNCLSSCVTIHVMLLMKSACLCGNWLFPFSNCQAPAKLTLLGALSASFCELLAFFCAPLFPLCALTVAVPIINAQNKPQIVNALFIILSPL